MRFIGKYGLTIAVYLTCFIAFGMYFYEFSKYAGVEEWPSVPAHKVRQETVSGSVRSDSYTGTKISHTSTTIVSYEYRVGDRQYSGSVSKPGGGRPQPNFNYEILDHDPASLQKGKSIPFREIAREWRAYYDSDNPSVAVLEPTPFRGHGYLWVGGFTGIIVSLHIFFSLKSRQNRL